MSTVPEARDALQLFASAAASAIASGAKADDLRRLVRDVQHDERAAARLGRTVIAGVVEWLGYGESP